MKLNHGGFGGVNEQVNQELLQHQMMGKNNFLMKANLSKFQGNTQQREFEEAMELDRILEEERRQQSIAVFVNAADKNYDNYLERLEAPNIKNASKGMSGVFGMGGDTGGPKNQFLM